MIEDLGAARVWSPPPPCPEHAGSKVIRNGTYGTRTPRPRQRYRCFPADGGKAHAFTPPLPRDHVHVAEGGCPECEELRGFHHGETAVARRHSWPTRLVARALAQLSQGGSYADTSRQALRTAERTADRHQELVGSGLTPQEADAVVDAEEAAADRGERPPAVERSVAEAGAGEWDAETATEAAVLEDQSRYRRRRRTRQQIADCRAYRPCPLDSWYDHLATAARGSVTTGSTKSFLHVSGENIGHGVFTTWADAGRMRLAEATAWLVFEEHRATGQETSAQSFAPYVHLAGGRQPRLVAAYATLLASPGGDDALERAIKTCDEALAGWAGNTADGWAELRAKRGQLAGRLTRLQSRLSTDLDDDGNPIPVRRHHPDDPKRLRRRRFAVG